MKTTLTARNLDLSPSLRARIERKLRRLERVAHADAEAKVELIAHASHASEQANVAEVTIVTNGSVVRSTSAGATPLAAIDTVLDKLERQVVRARQKPRSVRERAADQTATAAGVSTTRMAPDDTDGEPRVVRVKRFDMEPMFEEDAIARLEDLGHAFFVFLDAESDRIAVLYRRRDGGFGLIEPVIGTTGGGR